MAKKRDLTLSDNETISTPMDAPELLKSTSSIINTPALQALLDSGIITIVDGGIVWREGHLEHVQQLLADDPQQTARDYANELEVIGQYQ